MERVVKMGGLRGMGKMERRWGDVLGVKMDGNRVVRVVMLCWRWVGVWKCE